MKTDVTENSFAITCMHKFNLFLNLESFLFYFLLKVVKRGGGEEFSHGHFKSVADFFDGCDCGLTVGAMHDIVKRGLRKTANR